MLLNSSMMITSFLLLLLLPHVSSNIYGPRLLTSQVGGSVTIECYYLTTPANKHDRKYWCKESQNFRNCLTLISTTSFIDENYKTRVSIKDIPQNGILLVTMRQLEKNDSGRYRCGIGKNNNIGLSYGMNLNIFEVRNLSKSPEIFLGKVSGSVSIKCSSEDRKLSEKKFLCKLRRTGCALIADPNRNTSRFIFTAEDSSGNFHVLINRLRKEDSGMYKCGTGTPDNYKSARAVQLQVTEESVFSNILIYAQATSEPQTSGASSQSYVTSTDELYKDRYNSLTCSPAQSSSPSPYHSSIHLKCSWEDLCTWHNSTAVVLSLATGALWIGLPVIILNDFGLGFKIVLSSQTKPNLLLIVMPVLLLILVLTVTAIIIFVKVRQKKKYVPGDVDTRNPEVVIALTEQKCPEEQHEESRGSDEQESALGPNKEIPATSCYWLLSKPHSEESRETE